VDKVKQDAMCARLIAFSDYNTNPMCNLGDGIIEGIKSVYYVWSVVMQYYVGLVVAIWNCVNNPLTLDGFGDCAASVANSILPPEIMFDMVECQSGEILYRTIIFFISLFTPIFDGIYWFTGYPANGYYTASAIDVELVQARPLECAFATFMMSNMWGQWGIHALMQQSKTLVVFMESLQFSTPSLDPMLNFHRTCAEIFLTSVVFLFRDIIIAVMELVRMFATLIEYEIKRRRGDEFPNPRIPAQSFTDVQKQFVALVGVLEGLIELFSDTFFKAWRTY
jgi:hypothetical protein